MDSFGASDKQLKCKSKIFVMQIYEKDVELIEKPGSNGVENTFNILLSAGIFKCLDYIVFNIECMMLKYIL